MNVKLIVLKDTKRTYKDRNGQLVERRVIHASPAPDDGAKREMTIVLPPEGPALVPHQTYHFAIEDWRGYEGGVTFFGRLLDQFATP
jgi:hypothetical protein